MELNKRFVQQKTPKGHSAIYDKIHKGKVCMHTLVGKAQLSSSYNYIIMERTWWRGWDRSKKQNTKYDL